MLKYLNANKKNFSRKIRIYFKIKKKQSQDTKSESVKKILLNVRKKRR